MRILLAYGTSSGNSMGVQWAEETLRQLGHEVQTSECLESTLRRIESDVVDWLMVGTSYLSENASGDGGWRFQKMQRYLNREGQSLGLPTDFQPVPPLGLLAYGAALKGGIPGVLVNEMVDEDDITGAQFVRRLLLGNQLEAITNFMWDCPGGDSLQPIYHLALEYLRESLDSGMEGTTFWPLIQECCRRQSNTIARSELLGIDNPLSAQA
ncbi:MAG: hypothetical protein WCO52_01375 [bacterium]